MTMNTNDVENLLAVIKDVHAQHADDLCWMDIDRIFAAAGLPVPDRRVGNKEAMKRNCDRFIDVMCRDGVWKSYAELEQENFNLRTRRLFIIVFDGCEDGASVHSVHIDEQVAVREFVRLETGEKGQSWYSYHLGEWNVEENKEERCWDISRDQGLMVYDPVKREWTKYDLTNA